MRLSFLDMIQSPLSPTQYQVNVYALSTSKYPFISAHARNNRIDLRADVFTSSTATNSTRLSTGSWNKRSRKRTRMYAAHTRSSSPLEVIETGGKVGLITVSMYKYNWASFYLCCDGGCGGWWVMVASSSRSLFQRSSPPVYVASCSDVWVYANSRCAVFFFVCSEDFARPVNHVSKQSSWGEEGHRKHLVSPSSSSRSRNCFLPHAPILD
ncbi:hypothetical protein BX600DRAFT_234901 [Xylariales sp. PMI_506]|nr:hypothetical protein BX600DRAFT_234901 [Xylariales sp. PMI_506]